MKKINTYITEKLHINDEVEVKKVNKVEYKYHPKNNDELINLLKQLLKERGKDADLNDVDVSAITDMSDLFYRLSEKYNCEIENIEISQWDVSNVTNMESMFKNCDKFNCDISDWDTRRVKNMFGMFFNCKNFMSELYWDVENVEDFKSMFYKCEKFNGDIRRWNVSKGKDFTYMFAGCKDFTYDLSSWKPPKNAQCEFAFRNSGVKKIPEWAKNK